jgi:hypothetical protein
MARVAKKHPAVWVFVLGVVTIALGVLFYKSRALSHLAVWNMIESGRPEDFNWAPEAAPRYFYFEPDTQELASFRNDIQPFVQNEQDDLEIIKRVVKYVDDIQLNKCGGTKMLKWDSPEGMVKRIREGNSANSFHKAVIFSTYLASIGIKSRLWALENDCFSGRVRTVAEVYLRSLRKWVMVDPAFCFYATEGVIPLSLLELRQKVLSGNTSEVMVRYLGRKVVSWSRVPVAQARLMRCVFLRAKNDFFNSYSDRYGILTCCKKYIDNLPESLRLGVSYFLGRGYIFMHYVDKYSPSLKRAALFAKGAAIIFVALLLCFVFGLTFLLRDYFKRSVTKR